MRTFLKAAAFAGAFFVSPAMAGCGATAHTNEDANESVAAEQAAIKATAVAPKVTRSYWPTNGWQDASQATRDAKKKEFDALDAYLFPTQFPDDSRKGVRTDGLVIIHNGEVLYEKYNADRGWNKDKKHLSWSASKSVMNSFVGAAVAEGKIALDASICKYGVLPEGSKNCAITVKNLIEWSSGLEWYENYEDGSSPRKSSVLSMLYGEGRLDMAKFVATMHTTRVDPGSAWYYSSGDSVLLSGTLKAALGSAYASWPWDKIFNPLGMTTAVYETDRAGTYVGSSYFYATPRDMAKFGFLFLNGGTWDGKQVLPQSWIDYSTKVAPAFKVARLGTETDRDPLYVSGAHWWLNRAVPEQQLDQPYHDAPPDLFAARGHWGQSITVIPSLDVVLVRVADDRDGSFDFNQYMKLALACVK